MNPTCIVGFGGIVPDELFLTIWFLARVLNSDCVSVPTPIVQGSSFSRRKEQSHTFPANTSKTVGTFLKVSACSITLP